MSSHLSAGSSIPGTVVSWGYDPGGGVSRPSNLTNVTSISAYSTALAVRSDGTVSGWGDNTFGQAIPPVGLSNVVAVSAGEFHSLALLADGTVRQWGYQFMPPVPAGLHDAAGIAAGNSFSLVVRSNGTVIGWASNPTQATNVPPNLTNAVAIAAGQDFAVAVTKDGQVVAWGSGPGTNVPSNATNVVAVGVTPSAAQALRQDGSVVFWGYHQASEIPPPDNLSNVVAIGSFQALKADGTVAVWGANPAPYGSMQPPVGLSNVVAVASGPASLYYAVVQVDDAHPPSISVQDMTLAVAAVSNTALLTAVLSVPSPKEVSLEYQTVAGTAKDGEDYIGTHGCVVIPPNTNTATFPVTITGNILAGPTKTFSVAFSAPSNAILVTPQATVTLLNGNTLQVPPGFAASIVATNLSFPTAMAFAPDGRLVVCEQGGQAYFVQNGTVAAQPLLNLPVNTADFAEAGLLGITFDPGFATNHYLYVYYTVLANPPALTHNRVSRFTVQGDVAPTNTEFVVIDLNPLNSAAQHNGGALQFGPDGKLYIAVGDNAAGTNSQTTSNLLGKVLRINSDGTIPADNPFYLSAFGSNRAIWALGLRNPFSFAFHPLTGRMLINDVGESTWEEIDEGHAGANYGWPNAEGISTNAAFQNPIYEYGHSGTNGGCAIVAGVFYSPTSANFPAQFNGDYFFADYCGGWIQLLTPSNSATNFVAGLNSIVALQVGPDAALYVLSRASSGFAYRISWKDPTRIDRVTKTSGGPAQLTAASRPLHTYVLEASTNLIQWTPVQTNPAQGTTVDFSDTSATNFNRRFYRISE